MLLLLDTVLPYCSTTCTSFPSSNQPALLKQQTKQNYCDRTLPSFTRGREVPHPSKVALAVSPLQLRSVRDKHGVRPRPARHAQEIRYSSATLHAVPDVGEQNFLEKRLSGTCVSHGVNTAVVVAFVSVSTRLGARARSHWFSTIRPLYRTADR